MYLCLLPETPSIYTKILARRMKSGRTRRAEQGGKADADAAKFGRIRNELREEIHLAKRRSINPPAPSEGSDENETVCFAKLRKDPGLGGTGSLRQLCVAEATEVYSRFTQVFIASQPRAHVSHSGGRLVEEPRPSPLLGRKEDSSDVPHSSSP